MFALVIAIDRYRSDRIEDLAGCENDAKNIIGYLTGNLGVPPAHIKFLRNEEATREAILAAFQSHLLENPEIQNGDAIVFYYAGHGSRVESPREWLVPDGNMIETICPHDESTEDVTGNVVCGIPDRTFSALMRRLAHQKGDNITAIFDSCHSGGMSRNNMRARTIPTKVSASPPPADLDKDIWTWGLNARAATTAVPLGFQYKAMASHVMLAACRSSELALEASAEAEPCGAFTTALVKALRECSLLHTSYVRLMEMLPNLIFQNPQCEGTNKDRILFNATAVLDQSRTFKIYTEDGMSYVAAGAIHGVVEGTQFLLQSPQRASAFKPKQIDKTILVATHVHSLRSVIAPEDASIQFEARAGMRVIVLDWNICKMNVRFHWPAGTLYASTAPSVPSDLTIHCHERGNWQLERRDPLTQRLPNSIIEIRRDHPRLSETLDAIAYYNHHLYRLNKSRPIHTEVEIQLHQLERKEEDGHIALYLPAGPDFLDVKEDPVVCNKGTSYEIADVKEALITDMSTFYGVTLVNRSKHDLYPYVFYFDPSDYSIQVWYIPPSATMLAPLPRAKNGEPSKFPIGYGASGSDSIQFSLPHNLSMDSGFLKVFLSAAYVDMGIIQQTSPLTEFGRRARAETIPFDHIWDAWIYVLTCNKAGNKTEAKPT
ncbi:uncharacterized protein LAESUDRAFT_331738 [Laetiporus sulphureus 93-53]|uniref:Peptidase C14 caspase domain-containing protein n=1 Tax=Laetiporus sulphureus 93-53 TaxID=1314785 RepID=A0A165CXT3_9APHY|nr:uncharacterized protein LAESUDRAFT_331738 [Laetiporus sulphureus 93-53]KZT03693.1 hypothetical protein LAESUDRAFT_331738 [Laetiporus sulphureus 93-53]